MIPSDAYLLLTSVIKNEIYLLTFLLIHLNKSKNVRKRLPSASDYIRNVHKCLYIKLF